MSVGEAVFRWFFKIGITMLATYGLTQLFPTTDALFGIVRFAFFAIAISVIDLILLI